MTPSTSYSCLPPLTQNPIFWHPGLQGANSDASASSVSAEKGWGVCVFGYLAWGSWSQTVREGLEAELISISVLELLSYTAILHVAHKSGTLLKDRRIAIRNDNDSAVYCINTGKAYSTPMLVALRVFKAVSKALGITAIAQHVQGERNVISDHLIRARVDTAIEEARISFPVIRAVPGPTEMNEWILSVMRAAKADRRR